MGKISYEDLQNIEINATNKLLVYIDSLIDIHKLYGEVNKSFDFFKDESSRLAFNSWLTMDYADKYGETYIENFLKKIPSNLNQLERNILRGKSNSFISLLEIIKLENEYIVVKDLLNNLKYKLWEPKLKGLMKVGEIFLSRVGKTLNNYKFIGDINYLPVSVKPLFMENLLRDFNNTRKSYPQMDIRNYLKTNTLNIYNIYEHSLLNVENLQYEDDYILFTQLEEFESFLSSTLNPNIIKTHMSNLMNIYEYKLEEKAIYIKDIAFMDLREFLKEAIEDEFILTKEEFNSYIDTLKSYLGFLSSIDKKYKSSFKEILSISKDRFKYTKYLKSQSSIFNIDQSLTEIIGKHLDNDMINLLKDLDSFLSMVDKIVPELTKKNKYISRNDLYYINKNLRLKFKPSSKAPNQKDYPLIELFYFLSINLGLTEIIEGNLFITDKVDYFFRLKDEEKYSLICKYVLRGKFIEDKYLETINLFDISKIDFKNILLKIKDLNIAKSLFKQLYLLNIIKYQEESYYDNIVTTFGKIIINYFIKEEKEEKKSNIVYLETLKRG